MISYLPTAADPAAHHLGETETEPGLEELPSTKTINPEVRKPRSDSSYSTTSFSNGRPNLHFSKMNMTNTKRTRSISMHDLTHRFFRQPAIVLSRIDMFRSVIEYTVVVMQLTMIQEHRFRPYHSSFLLFIHSCPRPSLSTCLDCPFPPRSFLASIPFIRSRSPPSRAIENEMACETLSQALSLSR